MEHRKKKPNPFARPSVWGSSAWRFLHCISMTYPEKPSLQDKQDMAFFLYSIGPILPCKLCRPTYKDYVHTHPFQLSSRRALTRWMIDLHNHVNQRLHKPILTQKEAMDAIHSILTS
jgi:hypothetical protein